MKLNLSSSSLALMLALGSSLAWGQTVSPAKAADAKAAVAKVAKAPAAPKKAAAPAEVPLPAAEGEQNAAAAMTHFGDYVCEFKQPLQVAMNPKYDGYIDVTFGKQRYTMKPILSTTGALRLEDVKGQTLLLQIAYKSMLMDVKAGRRLVDDCVHEKQLMAKLAAEGKPQESMFSSDTAAAKPAPAAPAQ
jgi:hypothetical protein